MRFLDGEADIDDPLRGRLRAVDRRARGGRARRPGASTGSSTSTGSSRRSAPPRRACTAAIACGGTIASGPARCACPRLSARGRIRSSTVRRARRSRSGSTASPRRTTARRSPTGSRPKGFRRASRPSGRSSARSCCASWSARGSEVRQDRAAAQIEDGPASERSVRGLRAGADAATTTSSRSIQAGRRSTRGRVASGSGLVAAVRLGEEQPTWVVTGTDEAGVDAAIELLDTDSLRDRYAVGVDAARRRARAPGDGRSGRELIAIRTALAYTPRPGRLQAASGRPPLAYLGLVRGSSPSCSRTRSCSRERAAAVAVAGLAAGARAALAALAAMGPVARRRDRRRQRARHRPRRDGAGARLRRAGARADRRHARVGRRRRDPRACGSSS